MLSFRRYCQMVYKKEYNNLYFHQQYMGVPTAPHLHWQPVLLVYASIVV